MPNSSTDEWQIQERIARWNGTYEQIRINERAVIDIGIFVLKVVMTINAGALIAIIAGKTTLNGLPGGLQFFTGLLAAAAAAVFAYFWQRKITESLWNDFYTDFPRSKEPPPISGCVEARKRISMACNPFSHHLLRSVRLGRIFCVLRDRL